jgi:predicted NUDIX family phosphoesterase
LAVLLADALSREVKEEAPGLTCRAPVFLGIINEEQSEVGRVHIGAVSVLRCVKKPDSSSLSREIADSEWLMPAEIAEAGSAFDLWTRLALELLLCQT